MDERGELTQTKEQAADNIRKLGQLFPSVIKDGAVDFMALREELGESVDYESKRYELTWEGKQKAKRMAYEDVKGKTLRFIPEESKNAATTENLYIEGDNLEVLKLLRQAYEGMIRMIYIDPPYNTGKDFAYCDHFPYHANWLNMMYSRLLCSRSFLTEDGMIFISIEDNELANMIQICNEVFGEANYINTISVNTKVSAGASGGGEDKRLKKNIEYLIVYCKNADKLPPLSPIYKETDLMDYIRQMKQENKSFKYTNVLTRYSEITPYRVIQDGAGEDIRISKIKDYEIKTVKQIAKEEKISERKVYMKYYDRIMTTTNAQTSIRDRVWEATDSENTMYLVSYQPRSGKNKGKKTDLIFMGKQKVLVIWLKDTAIIRNGVIYKKEKIGTYWDGLSWINVSKEGGIKYENGKKPIALIQRMFRLLPWKEDMIVMDYFSGSATIGHAVMQENAEHPERKVKYIAIQLPERIQPVNKANQEYIKYLKKQEIPPVITEIGKARLDRAGERIKRDEQNKHVDIGYLVFRVTDSYIRRSSDFISGAKDRDLVYELMLYQKMVPLTSLLKLLSGIGERTYLYANQFVICLETHLTENVIEELASLSPLPIHFIFWESAYEQNRSLREMTERRLHSVEYI